MTVHPLILFAVVCFAFTVGAMCWSGDRDAEQATALQQERLRLEAWAAHLVRADVARGQVCKPAECVRRMSALQHCETELAELRDAINELPTEVEL